MFQASLLAVLAASPIGAMMSTRPRMGVIPAVTGALFLVWLVLLRASLPGLSRRMWRVLLWLSVATVISMIPRVLWRWAGAPPGWVTTIHAYLLGPSTVMQVAMLAGLVTAPIWVPLGRWAKKRLHALDAKEGGARTKWPVAPHSAAPDSAAREPVVLDPAAKELVPVRRTPLVTRRAMLHALPWALPGGAIVGASYGVLYESSHIVLRRVRIAIAGLPKALWGFRIGHVTDIHISRFQTQLRHLERGLELLAQEKLDLMCPTGDLCDEPRLHLDTLRLIKQVPARLGHIACVGNHELYLADPLTIARAYDKAQIQLLEEESVLVGGLRLSGVGFAHSAKVPRLDERLVPRQLEAALRDRRTGEPTILLAHHPHVFRHVTGKEVMLQLSGHTHGGQVGLFGHAILEPVYPLIRGHYRAAKDSAQLFVSAGLGHWLPFRFGCPPEVVVIELVPA